MSMISGSRCDFSTLIFASFVDVLRSFEVPRNVVKNSKRGGSGCARVASRAGERCGRRVRADVSAALGLAANTNPELLEALEPFLADADPRVVVGATYRYASPDRPPE